MQQLLAWVNEPSAPKPATVQAAGFNPNRLDTYARVLARAKGAAERRALAAEYGAEPRISEERVDPTQVASIVTEAAAARNGWKVILARCAPTTKAVEARKFSNLR